MDKRALLLAPFVLWVACGGSESSGLFGGAKPTGAGSGGDDSSGPGVGPSSSNSVGGSSSSHGGGGGGNSSVSSAGGGDSVGGGGAGGAMQTTSSMSANSSTASNSSTNSSTASSSSVGAGGSDGGVIDPLLIDDMEDGDQRILDIGGRTGYWYSQNDGTGAEVPAPLSTFLPVPIVPPRDMSTKGMHVTGAGFGNWGAVAKFDFNNAVSGLMGNVGAPQPYNISAYQGVAFWARGTTSVRFEIRQRNLSLVAEGGTCNAACSDYYGTSVPLTATWTLYALTFSSFKQRGFGAVAAFTPNDVLGGQFVMIPPSFDFWIDDIRFF